MAISVGFDLADVSSVQESLAAHGERYLERIYSPGERAACGDDPRGLAARFAAKEATLKMLQRVDEPVPWTAIEVVDEHEDPAGIVLHGRALELAQKRGITRLSLSFSTAGTHPAALVMGETR